MKPRQEDKVIVEVFTDYEGGGALSLAQDLMVISFSYDFNNCTFQAGTKEYLEEIDLLSVPTPKDRKKFIDTNSSNFQLEKCEVWITNKNYVVSRSSGLDLKQKINKSICMLSDSSKRHPWINKASPYNLFRARPVYMAPSHLKIKQLA